MRLDSTHVFVVSYSISGKKVCTWTVDTRKKTVRHEDVFKNMKKDTKKDK